MTFPYLKIIETEITDLFETHAQSSDFRIDLTAQLRRMLKSAYTKLSTLDKLLLDLLVVSTILLRGHCDWLNLFIK